jgi:hypothetical protein
VIRRWCRFAAQDHGNHRLRFCQQQLALLVAVGSVNLDPARVGLDAGRIADEVISHLAGLVGSSVNVTLDIEATIETGAPETVVRTVTDNSRTLKFTTQGFEEE